MEMPLSTLFLTNTLICALLASHLIIRPIKSEHTAVLGSCYSLVALLHVLGYVFLISGVWQVGALRAIAATLLGPLYYYYFQMVLSPHKVQIKRIALHCLPAVFVTLALFGRFTFLTNWVDPLLLLSFWGYLGLTINELVKSKAELKSTKTMPMVFQWLRLLVVTLAVNAFVELLIVWELSTGKLLAESVFAILFALMFLVTNMLTLYCALQRHPLWDWMLETQSNIRFDRNKTKQVSDATTALIKKFTEQLNELEWFKVESGFTIAMAASELGVSQRQLSEAINTETGQSYSQFMNKRRVDEAVKIIRQNPKKPLTAVIYDSGFRTKSSFNREFANLIGVTPSEFQKILTLDVEIQT
ncbi:MAG: helix-turn-helix domain-containing protein [Paraglaciecola sp.]|uniref:AraC family transcriptional regulator n=1 Tax=Paraglaciecola sp. TaxID=1920173 RepID=UPI0032654250